MKLLLDENLSPRLIEVLSELYPGTALLVSQYEAVRKFIVEDQETCLLLGRE